MVSPKSHKLAQVYRRGRTYLGLTRPDPKELAPFIDPELKAGDLLLTSEHTCIVRPLARLQMTVVGFSINIVRSRASLRRLLSV